MMAGAGPFGGEYEQAVVYSILNSDPEPLTSIRTGVPMEMERIVAKLLAKAANNRFQSADDLLVDLRNLNLASSRISTSSHSHSKITVSPVEGPAESIGVPSWAWVLTGLVVGLAFMQFVVGDSAQFEHEAVHSHINLPAGVTLAPRLMAPLRIDRQAIALSQDGKTLAIVGSFLETSSIYVRRLSENVFRRLTGTEGAYAVAFSPSGEQIAFYVRDRLIVVSVSAGSPREIARVALPYGLLWLNDDTLLINDDEGISLKMVNVSERSVSKLNIAANVESQILMGEVFEPTGLLPDGTVMANSWSLNASYQIDLDNNQAEQITVQQSSPRFISSGYVVAVDGMGVTISAADEETGLSIGPSVSLMDSLYFRYTAQFAVSSSGIFVAARGLNLSRTRFKWLNRDGSFTPLPFPKEDYGKFEISPDGGSLVVQVFGVEGSDIWIFNLERGSSTRLTNEGRNSTPLWTSDSKSVIYQNRMSSRSLLLKQDVDGLSLPDTMATRLLHPEFISPDGQHVGVAFKDGEDSFDLLYFDVDDSSKLIPIAANSGATEGLSKISAAGDFVAYTSSQTGNYEIYVQPFPPDGRVWNVSVGGGEEPVWADDDNTIYYRYGDRLFSTDVEHGPDGLSFGIPKLVYDEPFENVGGHSIDVSPVDGRVLMLKGEKDPEPVTSLELITNVTSLVKDQ